MRDEGSGKIENLTVVKVLTAMPWESSLSERRAVQEDFAGEVMKKFDKVKF